MTDSHHRLDRTDWRPSLGVALTFHADMSLLLVTSGTGGLEGTAPSLSQIAVAAC